MRDLAQKIFDRAEDIDLALHQLAGCTDALEVALSDKPDMDRAIMALIAASRLFQERASADVNVIARSFAAGA